MSWHVRYIDKELKNEILSPEFESKRAALEHALVLAGTDCDITAIEGPDEELVTLEEIELWFDERRQGQAGN